MPARHERRAPENVVWRSMIQRCTNPHAKSFADYGGRGVTVCDRWRESFAAFRADVGPRPAGTSLDRIDNDRGYEPGNVRWATQTEQCRNKRNNTTATLNGETLCLSSWAERLNIAVNTLLWRRARGWTDVEILTRPVRRSTRRGVSGLWRSPRHTGVQTPPRSHA